MLRADLEGIVCRPEKGGGYRVKIAEGHGTMAAILLALPLGPVRRHSLLGGVSPNEFETAHRKKRSGVY